MPLSRRPELTLTSRHALVLALVSLGSSCAASDGAAPRLLRLEDGASLSYRVVGAGPDTAIVVGGTPGVPAAVLRDGLTPLPGHALVFYDMRDRGDSPVVGGAPPPSLPRDVADLDALRRHLGLTRPSLVAHYYGAAVATQYAASQPASVARVALIGPIQPKSDNAYELALWSTKTPEAMASYFDDLARRRDSLDPAGFCRDHWVRIFEPVWIDDDAVRRAHADAVCLERGEGMSEAARVSPMLRSSLNASGWNWLESPLPAIEVPVLVVAGNRDPVRRFLARWWSYAAPVGRVLLVDGEATFPWVASAASVRGALIQFLGGNWPQGSVRLSAHPEPDVTLEEQARMPMSAVLVDP